MAAERVDEEIMLAGEDVVKKTQTDVPVVGEGDRFLSGPLLILRVGFLQSREITEFCRSARRARLEQQFGRVARVALDPPV